MKDNPYVDEDLRCLEKGESEYMKKLRIKTPNNIDEALEQGGIVVYETESYCNVQMPKKFSWLSFILLALLLNIFGLFMYLFYYYAFKKEELIQFYTRESDNNGKQKDGPRRESGRRTRNDDK